jgi:RHS repeat-associated protein
VYQFVYDATAGIPAVVEEVTPGGSVYYIREPDGSLIARLGSEGVRYYHFDALGSTRLLTDATGTITDQYSYDAWGNTSHQALPGSVDQPYQYVGRLGYYTHHQDANIALLELGVRLYDPQTGRFIQTDPMRDNRAAASRYPYTDNNPIIRIDPSGRSYVFVGACVVGGGIAVGLIGRYLNRIRRCHVVREEVECYVPATYNCTWPQRRGEEVWCNDLFMHCVALCRLASRYGEWMADWCQDWRRHDPEERRADEYGKACARQGNKTVAACAKCCEKGYNPTEPGP